MGQIVDGNYIVSCPNKYYKDQKSNCYFCLKTCCTYCKRAGKLENQLYIKRFDLTGEIRIVASFLCGSS